MKADVLYMQSPVKQAFITHDNMELSQGVFESPPATYW